MRLAKRVKSLEAKAPVRDRIWYEDEGFQERWYKLLKRWVRLINATELLWSADEVAKVVEACNLYIADRKGPFKDWMDEVWHGHACIPKLTAETTKALIEAWLSGNADDSRTCRMCGLNVPHHRRPPSDQWKLLPGKVPYKSEMPWFDFPEFFPSCPHCGGSNDERDFPWHTPKHDRSWKRLDGNVALYVQTIPELPYSARG